MVTSVTYNKIEKEVSQLNKMVRDLAARLTDEQWMYQILNNQKAVKEFVEDTPLIDVLFYDVTGEGDIELLEKLRESYRSTHIMLLADCKISPMKYMKPGIQAQSLLLRPWSNEQASESVTDFITEYVKAAFGEKRDESATMLVESRDGKVNVPYDQIFYFEAMEKKVYVCTGADEYGFYGTLESLEESLPEGFLRCHRSFIVNSDKITKVALSQSTIYLKDGYEVPLSRSYKPTFKGM
ncbi:MAG: LytTR family transcriptional regulator DNA-binding domain-containing protein [Lachnospiraceae bacterium]|nr:LytTR family transcriptional regulator DNA-binding domain-containing protein [Candidatus Colinaster scatohippi]